jgi:hypothetical protein
VGVRPGLPGLASHINALLLLLAAATAGRTCRCPGFPAPPSLACLTAAEFEELADGIQRQRLQLEQQCKALLEWHRLQ